MLLTTDADLAGAVLHAKSSGLKVAHFLAFCDYLFQVQVAGLQITCSIHLTITNVHLQVLKLHIEDPSLNTEVTKPSQELAPPPRSSGISLVHVGLMAGVVALSGAAVMVYLKRSQL